MQSFFVTMVEFSTKKTIVCFFFGKEMLFRILLMANKQRYVHFISLPTLDPNSPA